jgi:ubiquinone biosynthesis protein
VIVMATSVLATSVPEFLIRVVLAAALAVLTTWLSLRLLGVRRGWSKALASGLVGWGTAGLLALGLNRWDWGADGLIIQTIGIALPATMAVAVGLDLLARPGTLARAEQAGMLVAPRPLRSLRRRVDVFRRYRELLDLGRAQGFGPMAGAAGRAEREAEPVGVRLRRVLEQAGGVYVKLGQIAATRVDLLPPDVCAELAKLQSGAPPEPVDGIREVIEAELGGPVEDLFADFAWEPLAAASIGQTHQARLHSGEHVVVKIQRPGIAAVMERDLAALALLADFAERRTSIGRTLGTGDVLGQFARSLRAELDFTSEARATVEMGALMASAREGVAVRVPRVHLDQCTARVIVEEQFDGFTVDDAAALAAADVDRRELATCLLRTALHQILDMGFFHADPHPGNVFVLTDGSLGLIDFGAVGRLDPLQRAAVVEMMAALASQDVALLRSGIEQIADMDAPPSAERLERALARLMSESIGPSGSISPDVLQSLVPVLGEFGIRLPGDLVLLSRALVTLDGTIGVISPGLSVVAMALELAGPGAEQPVVDPQAQLQKELAAAAVRLRHLPDRLDRTMTLAARGDLRFRTVLAEDDARLLRTLVNRALLAAVGGVLLLTSALLLAAARDSRAVVGGVTMYEIFGYGGLLAGAVLVLRVVAQVARDGTT